MYVPDLTLSLRLQGLGLVFVAVYQKALKLLYVDELLERVKHEFAQQYKPDQVPSSNSDHTYFVLRSVANCLS